MNVSTIASNARALIVKTGWAQKGDTSGNCIIQAIWEVSPKDSDGYLQGDVFYETTDEVRRTLGCGKRFRLDHWNDDPNRTQQEVLDVLQRTAIRLDAVQEVYR